MAHRDKRHHTVGQSKGVGTGDTCRMSGPALSAGAEKCPNRQWDRLNEVSKGAGAEGQLSNRGEAKVPGTWDLR